MEHKIIKEEKNPFLSRTEYEIEIESDVTPNESQIKEMLGKDIELTVVKKINTKFGRQIVVAEAVVYNNKEDKDKIEVIPKKVRKKMEADKKAEIEAARKAEEAAKKAEEAARKAEEEKKANEEIEGVKSE